MNNLEARIAQLERTTRMYRLVFLGILALAGGLVFMSFNQKQDIPELLQAKRIQLLDNEGNVIAEMKRDRNTGNGELTTYSSNGKMLISLFTSDGGAGAINTFDKNERALFKLTQTTGGGGYMAIFNEDLREIVEFGTTNTSGGYMRINDRYSNKLAWITYTEGGGGYFSLLNDSKEYIRFSTPKAGGRIGVYNGNNTRIVFMGAQDNKEGNVTVYNNTGQRFGSIPN